MVAWSQKDGSLPTIIFGRRAVCFREGSSTNALLVVNCTGLLFPGISDDKGFITWKLCPWAVKNITIKHQLNYYGIFLQLGDQKVPLNHLVWVHLYTFYEPLRTPSPGHHQDDGGQPFLGSWVSRTKSEIGCHCCSSDPFLLWDAISRMPPFWVPLGFFKKKRRSCWILIWQWKKYTIWVIWCDVFDWRKMGKMGKGTTFWFFSHHAFRLLFFHDGKSRAQFDPKTLKSSKGWGMNSLQSWWFQPI